MRRCSLAWGWHDMEIQCKVIDIKSFQKDKKENIEEWLEEKVLKKYVHEDKELVLRNPVLRILIKFEALDHDSQIELYGYAKSIIMGFGNEISMRDKLWSVIEKGSSKNGSWQAVEEFADTLLLKAGIYNG